MKRPNGQGKTTLLCILAGIIGADEGDIFLDGHPSTELQRYFALASDKINFPEFLTAKQILELHCQSWAVDHPEELIESFGFQDQLNTHYKNLSNGNKKKLQLIQAFSRKSQVTLLDEPAAGLDEQSREMLQAILKKHSGRVILTSHVGGFFDEIGFARMPLHHV